MEVIMYTRKVCPLCDKALELLKELQSEFDFTISEIDIYKDDSLLEKYQIMIPVVEINKREIDYGIIDIEKIRQHLLGYEKK